MKFALLILADTHINKQIAIQLRDKGIIVTFIIEQAELIEAMVLIENDLIEFG